ncbi:MAG: hypothetical protein HFACDABA_01457 [Anaerolineales bacterium]|nr:hypothetical protein [Anaerolineales bacterium]
MTLSRRDILKLSALVATSAALASCSRLERPITRTLAPVKVAAWSPLSEADYLALSRLTYGARPEERSRVAEIGLANWIEEQLAPETITDNASAFRLRNLSTLGMSASDLYDISDQIFENVDRRKVPRELKKAALLRQTYSRRQLFESVVEFWSDHFNITTEKNDCFYLKTVDDRDVIRKHALGSFRDLVQASAHSPAMLTYLDNQANTKGAPNENYARELMELHTLGVEGGYTQTDVMELARCLTGWGVKKNFWRGDFKFFEKRHDTGVKHVLGLELQNAGQAEAERVIDLLADHPSTARFIAVKLSRRFLSDLPPAEVVDKAAAAFTRSRGDIRSVLRVILLDGLPFAGPKYKRPVNFVVSALRLLNAETDGDNPIQDYLMQMGQSYFLWPTPDGYPDGVQAWQGNLMPRWQFAFALLNNEIKGTRINLQKLIGATGLQSLPEIVDALTSLLIGAPLPESERDALISNLKSAGANEDESTAIITAGILSSPAFQWR